MKQIAKTRQKPQPKPVEYESKTLKQPSIKQPTEVIKTVPVALKIAPKSIIKVENELNRTNTKPATASEPESKLAFTPKPIASIEKVQIHETGLSIPKTVRKSVDYKTVQIQKKVAPEKISVQPAQKTAKTPEITVEKAVIMSNIEQKKAVAQAPLENVGEHIPDVELNTVVKQESVPETVKDNAVQYVNVTNEIENSDRLYDESGVNDNYEDLLTLAKAEIGMTDTAVDTEDIVPIMDVSNVQEGHKIESDKTSRVITDVVEAIAEADGEIRIAVAETLLDIHDEIQQFTQDEVQDMRMIEAKIEQLFELLDIELAQEDIKTFVVLLIENQITLSEIITSQDSFDRGTHEILDSVTSFFQQFVKILEPLHTLIGRTALTAR